MRWLTFYILAYVVIGLQVGLGGYVSIHDAHPNLVLLGVLFITMHAPRDPALLGCFMLGLLQDLTAAEPLGVYAFGYSLVGMLVVYLREMVYREHILTHFFLALAGSLILGMVLLLHGFLRGPSIPLSLVFVGALYTAVLAPIVLGLLRKTKPLFAFDPLRLRRI